MITKDEIQELLHSTETYRVERTTSTGDMDKFQEAICAFANDLPNSRKNGYLILGAYDNGGNVGGKNGGDNVPSFVPSSFTSCHKSVTSRKENVLKLIMNPESKVGIYLRRWLGDGSEKKAGRKTVARQK